MIEKVGPFHKFWTVSLNSLLCAWVFLIFHVLLMYVKGFMDFLECIDISYGFAKYCMIR